MLEEFERELKISDVQRIYELKQQEGALQTGRSVADFPIAIDLEDQIFTNIDLGEIIIRLIKCTHYAAECIPYALVSNYRQLPHLGVRPQR